MSSGILIGCHHGLNNKDLDYIKRILKNLLEIYQDKTWVYELFNI